MYFFFIIYGGLLITDPDIGGQKKVSIPPDLDPKHMLIL